MGYDLLASVDRVDEAEPVVTHLASYRTWAEQTGVPFTETLDRALQIVEAGTDERGEFTITCRSGTVIGTAAA